MRPLYIVGAGGFGREVAWLVERLNSQHPTWELRGFIDDDRSIHGTVLNGLPIVGDCESLKKKDEDFWCVCSVGSAAIRKRIIGKLQTIEHLHFATLVDPGVTMSESVEIGEGSIICAGTILTVNIAIGEHCIINLDCTLGHDDVLDNYVTLYPSVNVSGNVAIGYESEMGTGAAIIQGIRITDQCILGAGAVVVKDIIDPGTYIGVPARKIKD